MSLFELALLAVGLSMDAFAASICKGLSLPTLRVRDSLTVGLWFGVFQAFMPLLGYALASTFSSLMVSVDHWVAFALLSFIGGTMIWESFSHTDTTCAPSLGPLDMLPLALATSVDALAVGATFAFLQVNILPAVSFIGTVTFFLSALGAKLGNLFGAKYRTGAERIGGLVLVFMGVKILLEHLFP